MDELNVYQKLADARILLQSAPMKKTGHNKFAGYTYFELSDFLPTINQIFHDCGLIGCVSFTPIEATLTVINSTKPDEYIVFSSPMSTAALKGCHDVQNLGAVQKYMRRYLYFIALEIVEHDELDAITGKKDAEPVRVSSKLNDDFAPITQSQRNLLFAVLKNSGKTPEELKVFLIERYQIASTKEIPSALFPEIRKWAEEVKNVA